MPRARRVGAFGIRWAHPGALTPRMVFFVKAMEVGLRRYADEMAEKVEQYAKDNAPWQDRTGDARSGLTAQARHRQQYYYIDLFHTVDYGIWLEIRWNGRYAIIEPTLRAMGPEIMGGLGIGELASG